MLMFRVKCNLKCTMVQECGIKICSENVYGLQNCSKVTYRPEIVLPTLNKDPETQFGTSRLLGKLLQLNGWFQLKKGR